MDFNLLPTEMLQHVFSYLSADELCQLTGQVCKYWNNLSYHPSLWKTVHLHGLVQSPNEIIRIAKNSSLARRLILSRISKPKWKFMSVLPECRNLRSIEFRYCSLNESRARNLVEALPLIDRVFIERCSICYITLYEFVKWTNLKTIELRVGMLLSEGNKGVVLIANKCENLENLTLGYCWAFDYSSLSHLIKLRGYMLKSLNDNFCRLPAHGYQFLTQCPNLINLNLCRTDNMTGGELMCLKPLRFMETLKFKHNGYLHAENFINLFEGTEFLNLVDLEFFSCNIDDEVITYATTSCPLLKNFQLSCCPYVSNAGIEHIINRCSNMERLSLFSLEITNECLVKIPEMMPNLVRLDINCSRTRSKKVLQYLKSKKPNLEIYGYNNIKMIV